MHVYLSQVSWAPDSINKHYASLCLQLFCCMSVSLGSSKDSVPQGHWWLVFHASYAWLFTEVHLKFLVVLVFNIYHSSFALEWKVYCPFRELFWIFENKIRAFCHFTCFHWLLLFPNWAFPVLSSLPPFFTLPFFFVLPISSDQGSCMKSTITKELSASEFAV